MEVGGTEGRDYVVAIADHKSEWITMPCGVPQGSILGPLFFIIHLLTLGHIIHENNVAYRSYADDSQIYLALSPSDYGPSDLDAKK